MAGAAGEAISLGPSATIQSHAQSLTREPTTFSYCSMTRAYLRVAWPLKTRRGGFMGRILMAIACSGAGFWLGSHRLVPVWAVVLLAFLGAFLWGLAEWMEPGEGDDDDAG